MTATKMVRSPSSSLVSLLCTLIREFKRQSLSLKKYGIYQAGFVGWIIIMAQVCAVVVVLCHVIIINIPGQRVAPVLCVLMSTLCYILCLCVADLLFFYVPYRLEWSSNSWLRHPRKNSVKRRGTWIALYFIISLFLFLVYCIHLSYTAAFQCLKKQVKWQSERESNKWNVFTSFLNTKTE